MLNKAAEQKEATFKKIQLTIDRQIENAREEFSIKISIINWPEDVVEKITLWVHDNNYKTRIEDIEKTEKSGALRHLHISWK